MKFPFFIELVDNEQRSCRKVVRPVAGQSGVLRLGWTTVGEVRAGCCGFWAPLWTGYTEKSLQKFGGKGRLSIVYHEGA